MYVDLLWVLAGLALLFFGAEWLVKGASDVALKLGISPLVVGLTVVAFGTSAPELLVCLDANAAGEPGLALGNIIGSNICNIALILGVGALIRPIVIDKQIIRREMPILVGASVVFIIMLIGAGTSTGQAGILRWEGVILVVGILTYVISSFIKSKNEPTQESDDFSAEDIKEAQSAGFAKMMMSIGLIVGGLAALKFGSGWLVVHGSAMALELGVPVAVVGLILVAFGTSLPELATSISASRKGQGDLITGNAVGSCIFNILAVIGITAVVKPIISQGVQPFDLWVMLGLSIAIVPFMWTKMRLGRMEGAILLVAYVGYIVLTYGIKQGFIQF